MRLRENVITKVLTKQGEIDNPFIIFGVGIDPNIPYARDVLECDKGILVDERMRTSDENIYCVGEAAQQRAGGFIAGRVKECTIQADVAIANLLGDESKTFTEEVSIDGLKVGSFLFADVTATDFNPKDSENETILITHGDRIDQYIVNNDRLKRFIGINTNIDLLALKRLIETDSPIDAAYLYSNRLMSEYGKLVCSCEGVHELELVEIIRENAVTSFAELKEHSKAGRTCGRCKQDICTIISATPVDPEEAARLRQERLDAAAAAELEKVRARIEKYNRLHPKNQLSAENFHEALESFEMSREFKPLDFDDYRIDAPASAVRGGRRRGGDTTQQNPDHLARTLRLYGKFGSVYQNLPPKSRRSYPQIHLARLS